MRLYIYKEEIGGAFFFLSRLSTCFFFFFSLFFGLLSPILHLLYRMNPILIVSIYLNVYFEDTRAVIKLAHWPAAQCLDFLSAGL
jgi:hypothetical protein